MVFNSLCDGSNYIDHEIIKIVVSSFPGTIMCKHCRIMNVYYLMTTEVSYSYHFFVQSFVYFKYLNEYSDVCI